jgi:hypothetical protein
MRVTSPRHIESSSPISMIHTPATCTAESFDPSSSISSVNHRWPSVLSAVDFNMPRTHEPNLGTADSPPYAAMHQWQSPAKPAL